MPMIHSCVEKIVSVINKTLSFDFNLRCPGILKRHLTLIPAVFFFIQSVKRVHRYVMNVCPVIAKMSKPVKCTTCNIVIDELLAFVQNKFSIIDEQSLVKICVSTFGGEQIEGSKSLLFESLADDDKRRNFTIRKRQSKHSRMMSDIINKFKSVDPELLPIFVVRDLEKLPAVNFDHLDVNKLLKNLTLLQDEVKNIKSTYATINDVEAVKQHFEGRQLSSFYSVCNVNKKTGGYLDEKQMNNELSMQPSSPKTTYRDIVINNSRGSCRNMTNERVTSAQPTATTMWAQGGGGWNVVKNKKSNKKIASKA